jgi:CRP/FNR family transcriptional regulator, anaerobic regulatory protein
MLTLIDPSTLEARTRSADSSFRLLSAGEILFREGDPRSHVYRLEKGAICLFRERAGGIRDVIEFAFPGDLVGLGYHDSHVSGAQATMDTSLICLPRTVIEPMLERPASNVARLTTAIEREVGFLREAQKRTAAAMPIGRIAALFVTLARCNAYEGRDPTVLTDSLSCGVVAGYLDMSVDELAHWLSELKHRDLVETSDRGLRLKNLDELERIADAAD